MGKYRYSTLEVFINEIIKVLSPEYQENGKEISIKDFRIEQYLNFAH